MADIHSAMAVQVLRLTRIVAINVSAWTCIHTFSINGKLSQSPSSSSQGIEMTPSRDKWIT